MPSSLPLLLFTQSSTSPVLAHLNSCSLLHLMVALCVSCRCLHARLEQQRKSKKGRRQERKAGPGKVAFSGSFLLKKRSLIYNILCFYFDLWCDLFVSK